MIYPLILAVSTDGLGWISPAAGVGLVAIIDLVSKVVYGLYSIVSTAKLTEADLGGVAAPRGIALGTAD